MAAHLTDAQVAQYRGRTLSAAALLELDQHLAGCDACRDLLYRAAQGATRLRELQRDLAEHLTYDQVVASAEGSPDPDIQQHLRECAMCQGEVDDLRRFRYQLASAPRPVSVMPARRALPYWPAIAAAILTVAGLAYWAMLHRAPEPPPQVAGVPAPPPKPAEPALSPDQQQAVQLALSTHKLERAPILDRLIGHQGVLLGAPPAAQPFQPTAPMGTTVLTDRPLFRWQPSPGATRYVVAVFDEDFRKVTESPAVTTTEWQPETPLPRARVLNWQITATAAGRTIRTPQPPAPEARFEIVSATTAAAIDSARRDHPTNHLLVAALLSRAGALDDLTHELDALSQTDPTLAESLRKR